MEKVDILKEVSFEELCERLKKVQLMGFADICVYEDANFEVRSCNPTYISNRIFTPQPSIYQTELDKIGKVNELFLKKGIDIFDLNGGYDFVSLGEREEKRWTIIPPIIERLPIPIKYYGWFDYGEAISDSLRNKLKEENLRLRDLDIILEYMLVTPWFDIICDGSHRIHFAVLDGRKQNLLFIDNIREGWPYYAIPQPYSKVHVEPFRDEEKLDKQHVVEEPAHKHLYRLFPSGGIFSGDVRSFKKS